MLIINPAQLDFTVELTRYYAASCDSQPCEVDWVLIEAGETKELEVAFSPDHELVPGDLVLYPVYHMTYAGFGEHDLELRAWSYEDSVFAYVQAPLD